MSPGGGRGGGGRGGVWTAGWAARQKTSEFVTLMDELPRTPSGKVRKDVLRALEKRRRAAGQIANGNCLRSHTTHLHHVFPFRCVLLRKVTIFVA
jgi:hypothetical protein